MLHSFFKDAELQRGMGWLFVGFIVIISFLAFVSWYSYAHAKIDAKQKTKSLALLLEEKVANEIGQVDAALQISQELMGEAILVRDISRKFNFLVNKIDGLQTLSFFDASGVLQFSNATDNAVSIDDRPHFQLLQNNPHIDISFSDVIVARVTGERSIAILRALRGDNGEFLGVVSALMSMEYIDNTIASLDVGSNGASVLRRVDTSNLISRAPYYNLEDINTPLPKGSEILNLIRSGVTEATVEFEAVTDGKRRLGSFRVTQEYPFYILVALCDDDYLKDWRYINIALFIISVLLSLGFISIVKKLIKSFNQEHKIQIQLSQANQKVNLLNKNLENEVARQTKALRNREAYLHTIFQTQPEIMIVTDGTNIQSVNHAMLDFTGFATLEEFQKSYDCICDLFVNKSGYLHKKEGDLNWLEFVLAHPDKNHKALIYKEDRLHTFSVRAKEFVIDEQKLAVAILSDISEDEDMMVRYRFALEGSNDGMWDYDTITQKTYLSPRWKELLGYSDDEIEDSSDEWWSRIHLDDYEDVKKALELCITHKDKRFETMHRLKHKNGDWIWIYSHGKMLFDDEGNVVRIVGVISDITSLKLQQQELKRLEMVLQQTPFGVMITDVDGVITYCNEFVEELMGYSISELVGTRIDSYVPPIQENKKSLQKVQEAVSLKKVYIGDFIVERKDGTQYKEHNIIAPVFIDGKLSSFIGIKQEFSDVIELQSLLEEKEQMLISQSRNAAMGEMIGMIAHQWRQPISVISMGVNNILADIELESLDLEELKENLNEILLQTKHLSQTIDDFRNFFKPDKQKKAINLTDTIKECLSIIGKSLTNNDIKVQLHLEAKQKITTFDRELLQVLLNIIKNAKEAIVEQGSHERFIKIETSDRQNAVAISICDSGGGISDDVIGSIFEPYFTTKDEKNGTGLGLYMSKTIVEKHLKGDISVENIGGGTCFRLYLPLKFGNGESDE